MKQTLACQHIHQPPEAPPPGALSPGIRAAVAYIEANYAEPITLAELSRLSGLSLHRFVTVFRSQIGIPPHRFVCQTRITQALALLRQGMSPAAVAADTGFYDQSHLSRHFKRACGTTPRSYMSGLSHLIPPHQETDLFVPS